MFAVTFVQVAPPSWVTWTLPSSVPAQMSPAFSGDSARLTMVQCVSAPEPAAVIFCGSCVERSGLMICQWLPPSLVLNSTFDPRYSACGSTGEKISNPRHGAKWQRRLAFYQKNLARATKGSKRRVRVKRHVARLHEKIANSRLDTLHKFSTAIVTRFDEIYIEDLNLRGMVQNHRLARSLSDAGLGQAARLLEEKAERYGRTIRRIDRWYPSSKTCSGCGHLQARMPLSARQWVCPQCGQTHDRDVNAAVNIKAVGQTVSAHGDGVRAARPKDRDANRPRSANLKDLAARG